MTYKLIVINTERQTIAAYNTTREVTRFDYTQSNLTRFAAHPAVAYCPTQQVAVKEIKAARKPEPKLWNWKSDTCACGAPMSKGAMRCRKCNDQHRRKPVAEVQG